MVKMRSGIFWCFAISLLALGASSPLYIEYFLPKVTLPVLGQIPSFTLVSSDDKSFPSSRLRNRPWIAYTFFSSCPEVCPAINAQAKKLLQALPSSSSAQLVAISVDPDTDTPAKLLSYVRQQAAFDQRWHFLTGDIGTINLVLHHGFGIPDLSDARMHSARFFLVDKFGNLRGSYQALSNESLKHMLGDLEILTHENRSPL